MARKLGINVFPHTLLSFDRNDEGKPTPSTVLWEVFIIHEKNNLSIRKFKIFFCFCMVIKTDEEEGWNT